MKTRKDGSVLRQLNTLFNLGVIGAMTDGQLLERFSTGRGETAELAFAALVERHGAMVLRVCRALLIEPHDAHDAFQATFLILVKKARALWVKDSLGPWLYQVAFRTASRARSANARRQWHERRRGELAAIFVEHEDRTASERERVLHEEIERLPERYRVPIVLCDLEGHTCEEVARRMGRPVGTVKSWRSRGRERLRGRLTRLGLAPAAGLGALLSADVARAAVPRLKAEEIVRLAVRVLSDRMTAGEVSASVRTLVNGVIKTMLLSKLRTIATTIFALTFLGAGLGAVAQVGSENPKKAGDEAHGDVPRPALALPRLSNSPPGKDSREIWKLLLPEAIRIGLANSKVSRLIKSPKDDGYEIAPLVADVDALRFKARVMAWVRSIEQQYWSLSQNQVQLWASETAVKLAEDALKREQAQSEIGPDNRANVNEARQRLDQFRLDLTAKTSNVITNERQLYRLLGLPPSEDRRIVPITPPTDILLKPDWATSLASMHEKQPDVVRMQEAVAKADLARDGSDQVERLKASLQQVVHEKTHTLARFFSEIDVNYKQLKKGSELRTAASRRMEAQRAFYEEGRITIERYLDAISQFANTVGQEALFKTNYNISIVALEEAKGTLLEYDKITVVDSPTPAQAAVARRKVGALHESIEPPTHTPTMPSARVDTAVLPTTGIETGERPEADLGGKTFSFHVTVGSGPRPVEIRGSFTISPGGSVETSKRR